MELSQLRTLADSPETRSSVDGNEVATLIEAMESQEPTRTRLASRTVASLFDGESPSVDPSRLPLRSALGTDDPRTIVATLDALQAIGDDRPAFVRDYVDDVTEQLGATDRAVRAAACSTLARLATDSPGSLRESVGALVGRTDDVDPRVAAGSLAALTPVVEDGYGPATRGVSVALNALDAGNAQLRWQAVHYLSTVATHVPDALSAKADGLDVALGDADGDCRTRGAYAVSELVKADATAVTGSLDRVAELLDDPRPVARQNAAYTLLVWDRESAGTAADAFPVEAVGRRLSTLLATDVLDVRANAAYLAATLVDHDPTAVAEQPTVARILREIRADEGVDVPDRVVDRVLDALDAISEDDVGSESAEFEASPETGAADDGAAGRESSTDHHPTTDTAVFPGRSETCPGCGADLGEYDDLAFCPGCGSEV